MRSRALLTVVGAALLLFAWPVAAQREHTRLTPNRSTAVSQAQATELTLTVTEAAVRPIQVWVRTAGVMDDAKRSVAAFVHASYAGRVKVGQRVRAFSPESRSRMYQATVTQTRPAPGGLAITATMAGQALEASRHYVLEIVTEEGEFLSVPNEAIIEGGGKPVVYVQEGEGVYAKREIEAGRQGELYTEIRGGLTAGEQVVTIGSFFIDAEHKLKGP